MGGGVVLSGSLPDQNRRNLLFFLLFDNLGAILLRGVYDLRVLFAVCVLERYLLLLYLDYDRLAPPRVSPHLLALTYLFVLDHLQIVAVVEAWEVVQV